MSVKALEKEYQQVVDQYNEMLSDLKEMEEEAENGMLPPEFIENLRKQISPIKQNFEWWSYVMFTLHEPNRKEKREKYRKNNAKKLSMLDPKNAPLQRIKLGDEALKNLKGMI